MVGLTLGLALGLGLLVLALHMISVALVRALRTYSRSRLEDLCALRGHADRADLIAHLDEVTERSAEALAVLTGLGLAALLGATAARVAPESAVVEAVVWISLAVGAVGHVIAGVLGRVHAERLLDAAWPLASLLRRLMAPLTFASRKVEAAAYRMARRSASAPRPASVEVEIHSVDLPTQDIEADLPESTREILERVVELSRRDVSEVMTPRSAIIALPASVSAQEAALAFRETGRSRIPLFGENRDDIVGILHIKDLFAEMVEPGTSPPSPRKLARPAYCVPETKNANELLAELRSRRTHLAIVLDEYGGVAGLTTLEDLIEHLVGPIDDEHDIPTPVDPVVPLGGSLYEVDAALPLDQLNERLGLHLPTDGDFQTVGGFVFNTLGRLPEVGDSLRHNGAYFTIIEVGDHSIRRLRLDLEPGPVDGGHLAVGSGQRSDVGPPS